MAPPKNQPSEPPFTHPSDAWTRAQFGRAADSETQDVSGAEAVNPWVDGSSPSGGATTKPAFPFSLRKLNVFIKRDINIRLEYRGWKNSCPMKRGKPIPLEDHVLHEMGRTYYLK